MIVPFYQRILSRVAAESFAKSGSLVDAFGAVLKRAQKDKMYVSALDAEAVARLGVEMSQRAKEIATGAFGPINSSNVPQLPVPLEHSQQFHYEFIIGYDFEQNGVTKIGYAPVMVISESALSYSEARDKAFKMLEESQQIRNRYGVEEGFDIRLDKTHLLRMFYGV